MQRITIVVVLAGVLGGGVDAAAQTSPIGRLLPEFRRIYTTWRPLLRKVLKKGTQPKLFTGSLDEARRDIDRAVNKIPRALPEYPVETYEMSANACRPTGDSVGVLAQVQRDLRDSTEAMEQLSQAKAAMIDVQARLMAGAEVWCEFEATIVDYKMCERLLEKALYDVEDAISTSLNGIDRLQKRTAHLQRDLSRRQQGKAECELKAAEDAAREAEQRITDDVTPEPPADGDGGQNAARMSPAECARARQMLAQARRYMHVSCGGDDRCAFNKRRGAQMHAEAAAQLARVCS